MKSRHPEWSKGTLLECLRGGDSLRECCRRFSGEASEAALVSETQSWRHNDPDFSDQYDEIMEDRRSGNLQGRPRKDDNPEAASWREDYVRALEETGDRVEAADYTPYDYKTLNRRLQPSDPSYDKTFADMVQEATLRWVAKYEGKVPEWIRKAEEDDRPYDAFRMFTRTAEAFDPDRWGKKASVKHDHTHRHKIQERKANLIELAREQSEFMAEIRNTKALPAHQESISVEVVEKVEVEA